MASQLLRVLLGLPSGEHKETTVDSKLFGAYLGSYEVSSSIISIVREGNHLFAQMHGQNYELYPESVRDFFFKAFHAQISFETDKDGQATELVWHDAGTDMRASRTK